MRIRVTFQRLYDALGNCHTNFKISALDFLLLWCIYGITVPTPSSKLTQWAESDILLAYSSTGSIWKVLFERPRKRTINCLFWPPSSWIAWSQFKSHDLEARSRLSLLLLIPQRFRCLPQIRIVLGCNHLQAFSSVSSYSSPHILNTYIMPLGLSVYPPCTVLCFDPSDYLGFI